MKRSMHPGNLLKRRLAGQQSGVLLDARSAERYRGEDGTNRSRLLDEFLVH